MKLDFRIDFGYLTLYSRRLYHPEMCWDGHLECEDGSILATQRLRYPVEWYGIAASAEKTPLPAPEWRATTRRGFTGVAFTAECTPQTRFRCVTEQGTWEFTAKQIQEDGRIVFRVGGRYSLATAIVTRAGFLWFRPAPPDGAAAWEGRDLPLPQLDRCRMELARLAPGAEVTLPLTALAPAPDAGRHLLAHLQAMPEGQPEDFRPCHGDDGTADPAVTAEICIRDFVTIEWRGRDGALLAATTHYFRYHDIWIQLLEDTWSEFILPEGATAITLRNCHPRLPLLLSRVVLQWQRREHLQLSLPEWLLVGEEFTARVWSETDDYATIEYEGDAHPLVLHPGWNDFPLQFRQAGLGLPVTVRCGKKSATAAVGAVVALPEEPIPVKVGADFTTVPHDDSNELEWTMDYIRRTRLGNFAALRSFTYDPNHQPELQGGPYAFFPGTHGKSLKPSMPPEQQAAWGEWAKNYRFWLQATTHYQDGRLAEAAGPWLHNAGPHEFSGRVYAWDPDNQSTDMRDAARRYVELLRSCTDPIRAKGMSPGLGDGSGGARYSYQGGFDFLRVETLVAHTGHLCSQARAATRAYARPEWGVHIAIQHAKWPYLESHLGEYYLALLQPWIMGASVLYEEDSLFLMFPEERQCWDDALTKGKRDMTRDFFRFAKLHPRNGAPLPRLAWLNGRYAAPFNGFICGPEQTPDYAVWGLFGRTDRCWRHAQPEKSQHLLDVWMPGACALPLRQDPAKRRFWVSGTPYGDFDQMPAEAPADQWRSYRLLVSFGWNTLEDEDAAKLDGYLRHGGVFAAGLPHWQTSVKREIVDAPATMPLWNGGDLAATCGFRVVGQGQEFSGAAEWLIPGFEEMPDLSALPNWSPDEDGPCRLADLELAGAEVVCRDAATKAPLVLRHRVGEGWCWTIAAWAWPGHERLRPVAAQLLAGLSKTAQGDISVSDPSGELFWSVRDAGPDARVLSLLNTAWNDPGCLREAQVATPAGTFPVAVREREAKFLFVTADWAIESQGHDIPHLEYADGVLRAYGDRPTAVLLHRGPDIIPLAIPAAPAGAAVPLP